MEHTWLYFNVLHRWICMRCRKEDKTRTKSLRPHGKCPGRSYEDERGMRGYGPALNHKKPTAAPESDKP